ncbi:hypothetical protein [Actinomadura rubrisoli]|uniref:Uncharacterized protein n=1 Tax=Actinomadura rubrisoli TaxID=2530368 RepID=A0A4R5ABG5_9ACTN|nr:hypothetical protein [Actinomadura rubrisoli]TDD68164.1 hypothetical protein E1298_38730 [Actinomadura rubrisoli]
MGRRSLAVLGGLMMTTGALVVVAPASLGVAPAPTTIRVPAGRSLFGASPARPLPVRSLTAPAFGAPRAARTGTAE